MVDDEQSRPGGQYWALIEPVWQAVDIYHGPELFVRSFEPIPKVAGHLFAAHWCQSEVCNGGLHQFFSNPTGVLAPEALHGFQAIGILEWAAILEEAMRFFGAPYPRDREERHSRLAARPGERREEWDPFYHLDERFYRWLRSGADRWPRAADEYATRA